MPCRTSYHTVQRITVTVSTVKKDSEVELGAEIDHDLLLRLVPLGPPRHSRIASLQHVAMGTRGGRRTHTRSALARAFFLAT